MTWLEWLIALIGIALVCVIVFVWVRLFQQTEIVGVLKWGFVLLAISCGSNSAKRST